MSNKTLKSAYGNYVTHRNVLGSDANLLRESINVSNYKTYKYNEINLFDIAEMEMKAILIPLHYKECLDNGVFVEFAINFDLHQQVIIDNYAASIFWLNYWKGVFSENGATQLDVQTPWPGRQAHCLLGRLKFLIFQ